MSVSKKLTSEPLPNKPRTADKDLKHWIDSITEWLRRLSANLSDDVIVQTVIQNGAGLPPIPDPTKDYILVYDSTDKTIKWIETTEDCDV